MAYDRFTTNKHIISRFSIHIVVNIYRLSHFTIHIITSAAYLLSLLSQVDYHLSLCLMSCAAFCISLSFIR